MLNVTSPVHVIVLAAAIALLVAVIWALVLTLANRAVAASVKVIWVILLIGLPVIGLALWLIVGPTRGQRTAPDQGA